MDAKGWKADEQEKEEGVLNVQEWRLVIKNKSVRERTQRDGR